MVSPAVVADGEGGLAEVNWYMHDAWFELANVWFDREHGTVRIPLTAGDPQGFVSGQLTISAVESLDIRDHSGVGSYDVYELRYVASKQTLELEANIPLALAMRVSHLHVELEGLYVASGSYPPPK